MTDIATHTHVKIWLEHQGNILLGVGRAQLLERIDSMGSLKKAAESMNMSYRAAWGRVKRTEAALSMPLVEALGTRRGGYSLTPEAKKIVTAFLQWHERVQQFALDEARRLGLLDMQGNKSTG